MKRGNLKVENMIYTTCNLNTGLIYGYICNDFIAVKVILKYVIMLPNIWDILCVAIVFLFAIIM